MPFTPFHLGPALLIGLSIRRFIHLPTLLLSSVIIDLEPFLVLVLNLNYPLYGFMHTFLIASLVGVIIGLVMKENEKFLHTLYQRLCLTKGATKTTQPFIITGVLGTLTHVLLDAPLYDDITPFFPIHLNLLYAPQLTPLIYSFCLFSGLFGVGLYLFLLLNRYIGRSRSQL
ncbi:MAG: hydrolase [Nitrososphaeria archaeon]